MSAVSQKKDQPQLDLGLPPAAHFEPHTVKNKRSIKPKTDVEQEEKAEVEQLTFDLSIALQQIITNAQAPISNTERANLGSKGKDTHRGRTQEKPKSKNLLKESSTHIEDTFDCGLIGTPIDISLEKADALFINSAGYILLAINTIYITARDIRDGSKQDPSPKERAYYVCAMEWINGESESPFPFEDCVKIIDYELRLQSLESTTLPDIANNPQVLRNWIVNRPDEAVHYLKNYKGLFNSDRASFAQEHSSFYGLQQSVQNSNNEASYEQFTQR